MKKDNEEYYIIEEVGVFGGLEEIDDPTATKVDKKKKKKTMEEIKKKKKKKNREKL